MSLLAEVDNSRKEERKLAHKMAVKREMTKRMVSGLRASQSGDEPPLPMLNEVEGSRGCNTSFWSQQLGCMGNEPGLNDGELYSGGGGADAAPRTNPAVPLSEQLQKESPSVVRVSVREDLGEGWGRIQGEVFRQ